MQEGWSFAITSPGVSRCGANCSSETRANLACHIWIQKHGTAVVYREIFLMSIVSSDKVVCSNTGTSVAAREQVGDFLYINVEERKRVSV